MSSPLVHQVDAAAMRAARARIRGLEARMAFETAKRHAARIRKLAEGARARFDARNERRQAAARAGIARAHADIEIEPRDDMRQPWPLVLGDWVRWEVRPVKRNVRQWWAVDERGEPIRGGDGIIVRAGVDRLVALASQKVPRNYLGMRAAGA